MGLTPEQEQQRLELYKKGLSDGEIAEKVRCAAQTICSWRKYRKLSANYPRGQTLGVPMEKVLTPEQCNVMRKFLRDLLRAHKVCGKIDIGSFLHEYRRYLNGYVRLDRRRHRNVPENMPGLREELV